MASGHRAELKKIRTFPALVAYLRDEMGWPIDKDSFDELTFDYTAEELGIDRANAAKIQEIKRLRPLTAKQPWGIFFVKFEPKTLPVVALRRILSRVVLKKRASANSSERAAWEVDDLLFVSNFGQGEQRQISFAHFSHEGANSDLPTLKVLGWDSSDTPLKLDAVADKLTDKLAWPADEADVAAWRESWRSAFTLRHGEVVTTSKALAVRLAELARSIRDRITTVLEIETDDGPVTKLMSAFQEALVHDLDADGFADMYAQTIAYGLLSARIEDPGSDSAEDFAAHMRTSPFLKELMESFLRAGGRQTNGDASSALDFDELGVSDVVELLDAANMEAVVRDFGDTNPLEDPVIHFYELFLKEYDAKKRMQRGVFYTPRPVVSYIVRSVHEVLQEEFELADGLADTTTWGEMAKRHKDLNIPEGTAPDHAFVQILDPGAGTGTFLVEVIDLIHKTLVDRWKAQGYGDKKITALWNEYVPTHLLPRLHGYELLMAPYAIAHLKIGLKLYETGYRFGSDERARVYLTNALEPAHDFSGQFDFAIPALAHEAQAVNAIKRNHRFSVVIGNPPYSGLSANMTGAASDLIEPYKYVDSVHFGERKHWLHDDYVKFVRFGEERVSAAGVGVLGLITNHAFYDNPTFRGMRWSLLQTFQRVALLDLHGNTMRRELSPDGGVDKNVFDIQQGVAISILARRPALDSVVTYADLWGARDQKYAALFGGDALSTPARLTPAPEFFFFVPRSDSHTEEYSAWPKLSGVFEVHSTGFITARDKFLVDIDRDALVERLSEFADPSVSDSEIRARYFEGRGSDKYPDGDSRGWKVPVARKRIQADPDWKSRIRRCLYRPFDERWIFWAEWMVDWPRSEVNGHFLHAGNLGLVFMRQAATGDVYSHFLVSRLPVDARACYSNKGIMSLAPLYLHEDGDVARGELALETPGTRANLAPGFQNAMCTALGLASSDELDGEEVFSYIYGIAHSPEYRARYTELLKTDFPHLPMPRSPKLFRQLAGIGRELVALHLMESPKLGRPTSSGAFTGSQNPEVERVRWSDDTVWLNAPASRKGRPPEPGTVGFRGVPEAVWDFQIGGYQVCDKWLKDRKGLKLSKDDFAHYQKIVTAVAETIRIVGEIDEVIDSHGGWPDAFVYQPAAAT